MFCCLVEYLSRGRGAHDDACAIRERLIARNPQFRVCVDPQDDDDYASLDVRNYDPVRDASGDHYEPPPADGVFVYISVTGSYVKNSYRVQVPVGDTCTVVTCYTLAGAVRAILRHF